MKEIEVKILNINPSEIVDKLKKAGAKMLGKGVIRSKCYDYPDDRLMKKKQFIRVRQFPDSCELVFKSPVSCDNTKIMDETEITISDFDTACSIFEKIGMKLFADAEKFRASYLINSTKFEFDKYPCLPWFVEVEAPTEKDLEKNLKFIGFSMEDENVTSKMLPEIYGKEYDFNSFKMKGESPDYNNLFN